MTVVDYQALVLTSGLVWRFIATIRTPILHPIKKQLAQFENGAWMYSAIVWLVAFVAGYQIAVMAGDNGNILHTLGWLEEYQQVGWAATAIVIACGSGGLRLAEKLYNAKTTPPNV